MKEWVELLKNGKPCLHKEDLKNNDYSRLDWDDIFDKLDTKDGKEDDRIPSQCFIEWMDALNFQDSLCLESKHGVNRSKLIQIAYEADIDEDGYIDRYEFKRLVDRHSNQWGKIQSSKFLSYIRIVAYAEEYRWLPPPWFTFISVVLLIGIYIFNEYFKSSGTVIFDMLVYNPARRYEVWRYFTYILLHGSVLHLTLNLCLLLMVSLPLEMTHGTVRTQIVALAGAITSCLLFSVSNPKAFLVGSSGAVTSLVTAHLASIILNWREDTLILRQRFRNSQATSPIFGKPVRIARVLLVIVILCLDIYKFCQDNEDTKIAFTAHIGGAVSGLFVGIVVLQNRRVQHWEVWAKGMCIAVVLTFISILIILNIVWSDGFYFPEQDHGPIHKDQPYVPEITTVVP